MATRIRLTIVVSLLGASLLVPPAVGAPGDLDKRFGGDGRVLTSFGDIDAGRGGLIQPNGRIVVVGRVGEASTPDFGVARYRPSGALDTSFGTGGKVATPMGMDTNDQAEDVALQADGKLVVAGNSNDSGAWQIALARYGTDGQLDTSFGGTGKVITTVGGIEDVVLGVAVQKDGKIVAVGSTAPNATDYNLLLVRYLSNGDPDPGFGGGDGIVTVPFGSIAEASEVAIQRDGKIVIAGVHKAGSFFNVLVARFRTDGTADPTFGGGDGLVSTPIGAEDDQGTDVVVRSDGKILVAGFTENGTASRSVLLRYRSGGALDGSFSGDGIARAPYASTGQARASLAVQKDGKVLIASYRGTPTQDFAVARFKSSGGVDKSFGDAGSVRTDFAGDMDRARMVALQKDGGIVAAGDAMGSTTDFALARYKNDLTFTSLKDPKLGTRLRVRGKLMPPRRGQRMVVSLYVRRGGRFRKVATVRPRLSRAKDIDGDGIKESTFRASFQRPGPGRCRVVAIYRGDAGHLPSRARRSC